MTSLHALKFAMVFTFAIPAVIFGSVYFIATFAP